MSYLELYKQRLDEARREYTIVSMQLAHCPVIMGGYFDADVFEPLSADYLELANRISVLEFLINDATVNPY